jgi:Uma2 family endonuclease
MVALKRACPPDLLVAVGSLDFRPTLDISLRPDLLVCPRAAAGSRLLTSPPLLAVEVLSPTTRTTDVVLKRTLYEHHGVQSYWLLDTTTQELTILTLAEATYTCHAVLQGSETFETTHPFPLTLTPAALLR